uniref:Ig-like domain-containing protein n=1 Tax=Eptatretus burgeri TaxID=7764 RepID=A0A8C4QVC4_EPTBU
MKILPKVKTIRRPCYRSPESCTNELPWGLSRDRELSNHTGLQAAMSSHNIWTVEEGGSVDLNCSVSKDSSSHVDIEWYFTNNENNTSLIAMQYKKEQIIKGKKERIRFLGKDFDFVRLQITELQVQDSGKYTAKIKTVVDKEPYFKNCSYNLLVKQSRGDWDFGEPW